MSKQQVYPEFKCRESSSYFRASCGSPSVIVKQERGEGGRLIPLCSKHAGAFKRSTYTYGATLVPVEDVRERLEAEEAERKAFEAERRTKENAEAERRQAAYTKQRIAEAAVEWTVNYEPVTKVEWSDKSEWVEPVWALREVGSDREYAEVEVKIEREEGRPPRIISRNGSHLTVNQAEALILALQSAVSVAKRGN